MSNNTTNVLASGIEIIGSIRFTNDMHIDGKIEGQILSESGKVTIGEQADIKGDINAGEVSVYGHVNGNIKSNRCHLKDHAVISGDITTAVLSMDEGARLSGRAEIG
ncbi:MAG TPA: polymer-forming cytoskeletal protein [Candidatus Akkermansia intestinigallinarum]|uniref:Polymer-forming cytoskeletal protein n=1 Tax=Candidatus Akkermansia intestinigallinarum TaxID=2838431 RepID=A0A9D1VC19_9BACT|nr:polymer-forming cytoskeletal protein [Candidatus Akkermansia intestinigallinarum]